EVVARVVMRERAAGWARADVLHRAGIAAHERIAARPSKQQIAGDEHVAALALPAQRTRDVLLRFAMLSALERAQHAVATHCVTSSPQLGERSDPRGRVGPGGLCPTGGTVA